MAKRQKLDLVHATPSQITELKADIDAAKRMLDADAQSGRPKIQDRQEFVREHITAKQKILDDHSPKRLRGENANKLLKQAREMADEITEAMPKTNDYYQRYPKGGGSSHDFERAVKQQMAFQTNKVLQKKITAYKNIMARIDPDDPTIRNIEKLRG